MTPSLESIRACLEGVVPSLVATCAADGVPNLTYVSQVHYVDRRHVALSFQFFNKTRENILANPQATVFLLDPRTAARYVLQVRYLRTETSGGLFERMKAHLAGIASHTGMAGVFKLQGADVYEVLGIEHLPGAELAPPPERSGLLGAVRHVSTLLASASDLNTILDDVLAVLEADLGITHAMVMLIDRSHERLFTVASRGYPASGVGSEIGLGHGVIGVAAREGTAIRIAHGTSEYAYSRTMRERAERHGLAELLETEIPLPGLTTPGSQLAVPLRVSGCTVGVLFVESPQEARFSWEDEDALVAIAAQLGTTIVVLQQAADASDDEPARREHAPTPRGTPLVVRHYAADHSVFIGDEYLIKGVAGAIFRKLVRDFLVEGRTDFTNRELRLDPSIRLPDITDNLEARLILLVRRLQERGPDIQIEKTGRGRFHLSVQRPLTLTEVG
ncbi:MAG TPA: GAF domain-containing protein [Burkholderiaceae bacterium]|nr:GAF domain-containing protein [Burkholderiaceae bacterium]HQR78152.1 GAF domain-containing protein [Burkholderiaceae bacterium]